MIEEAIETAKFYQKCSDDKTTLRFGYSQVIDRLRCPNKPNEKFLKAAKRHKEITDKSKDNRTI
jgi:hypothetical protein